MMKIINMISSAVGILLSILAFFSELENISILKGYAQAIRVLLALFVIAYSTSICYAIISMLLGKHILAKSKQRKFKVPSSKHTKFFTEWYKKEGILTVYVQDLNGWATPSTTTIDELRNGTVSDNSIYNELLRKSTQNRLNLYIDMENKDKYVEYLQENGASLFPITNSDLRFSIIQAGGSTSAILRDIESGVDKNIIEEIEPQSIVIKLLKEIIK